MQQRNLDYALRSARPGSGWFPTFLWTIGSVFAWQAAATGAIVLYAHLHIRRGWPTLPEWFNFDGVFYCGSVAVAVAVIFLGVGGRLPGGGGRKQLHNQPLQRTGDAVE